MIFVLNASSLARAALTHFVFYCCIFNDTSLVKFQMEHLVRTFWFCSFTFSIVIFHFLVKISRKTADNK